GISIQVVPFAAEFKEKLTELQSEASLDGQSIDLKTAFHQRFLFPMLKQLKEHHLFDKIATGHRALLQEDQVAKRIRIFQSENPNMDEAELLLGLSQADLGSLILPLGSIPDFMLQKLAKELAVTADPDEWLALQELRTFSTLGFEAVSVSGISLGLVKEEGLVPGMFYDSLNTPGVRYRATDVSFAHHRIIVTEESELQIQEIIFEDCSWFGRGDLKLKRLECSMRTLNHLKPISIKLLEFEGNRLKGYLNQPLRGEEANIFKGETVLWIEGTEILGGGRVFRTN
ncbi:MAG: hypothetical protein H7333_11735, partial [Bdellovibrionales bacterium]|nr:hypothetical protein [Oligoflexia bacterium]